MLIKDVIVCFDVDGVLSPVVAPDEVKLSVSGWEEHLSVKVTGFPMVVFPQLISSIKDLLTNPSVSARWLTTWGSRAATDFAPAVGLKSACDWTVLDSRDEQNLEWWKPARILELREQNPTSAIVWIDDDINDWVEEWSTLEDAPNPDGFDLAQKLINDPFIFRVSPDLTVGVTALQMRQVFNWVSAQV